MRRGIITGSLGPARGATLGVKPALKVGVGLPVVQPAPAQVTPNPLLFYGLYPSQVIYVQAGATATGANGTLAKPYPTIQQGMNAATPGTMIAVKAGTYNEEAKFPSGKGGTDSAPIWLESVDGRGAAIVICPAGGYGAIRGLGVFNISVRGFDARGGINGAIQFSQSGSDFSKMCRNILVQHNICTNPNNSDGDGIKISQADNVQTLDNTSTNCGDQCIDYVNVWNGWCAYNELATCHEAAAFFAKDGSQNIICENNYVHDMGGVGDTADYTVSGLAAGGYAGAGFARPGSPTDDSGKVIEVVNMVIRNNRIASCYGTAIVATGAWGVSVTGNDIASLVDVPGHTSSNFCLGAQQDNLGVISKNVVFDGNYLAPTGKPAFSYDKQHQDPTRDTLVYQNPLGAPPALTVGPRAWWAWPQAAGGSYAAASPPPQGGSGISAALVAAAL